MAINVAKVVALHDDPRLRDVVERCELISVDGQPIVWASRLLGDPLPERVAGIDLMFRLLELAAERGYRVYVLGARQEVLETAIARLLERYPGLSSPAPPRLLQGRGARRSASSCGPPSPTSCSSP